MILQASNSEVKEKEMKVGRLLFVPRYGREFMRLI